MTRTVLPTPAPPNIAAFPPWASGARRSITLMPVSNKAVAEVSSSSAGGVLWMLRRGVPAGRAGPRSRTVPTTSRRRPRTASPTGTEIGSPVARTLVPRARPDVACNAMPRTVLGSTWLCTSSTNGSGRSHSTTSSVLTGGSSPSNTTSTTGAADRHDHAPRCGLSGPLLVAVVFAPELVRTDLVPGGHRRRADGGVQHGTGFLGCGRRGRESIVWHAPPFALRDRLDGANQP